ncbi:hypothetical protein [Arenibacter certesii]|uniref:Lipoprotein n=1 Tax=Arenibacter certesii TaxID=228955 RepID=A0A918J2E9_9FLAO|nr:hypothetical protein [Arenibacter certesii]GGW44317.1 hypothetical protein GCM10007383_30930 [Arenibacter certesii]
MKCLHLSRTYSALVKKGGIFIFGIVFLGSCSANKRSYAIKGEKVEIELLEHEKQLEGFLPSVLGLVIPKLINWGVTGTKTLIDKQAEKYTADYSASISRNDFYLPSEGENRLKQKYRGIQISRKAAISSKNKESSTTELSSNFIFHFDLNPERTFMSLNPKKIAVYYAKAKLNEKDENLDVVVSISISSTWVDAGQTFNKKEIGSFEFRFSDIVINQVYDENSSQIKLQQDNWFPLPPVSVDSGNTVADYGYFDINIKVIETDDFGKRLEKYSNTINSNSDLINSVLNKLVE